MADMIQGLSIGLQLDTSGIEQSLKQLKGQLKLVDSEMRVNMSAFSRSEKSSAKYETQITGLNKKLDAQKAAVNQARREHERMVAQHGEGSRQAQISAASYNNLSADFNNLQRHIGDLTEEFQQFQREQEIAESRFGQLSSSLEDMGSRMSEVGDKISGLGKGITAGLTLPIVAFSAAGVAAFNEVDEAVDTIITKTGATGEAAEALTENFRTVAKRVPDDLLSVGEAIGEVNTQFGFLGKELEDNSQLMLEFANINGTDVTSSSIASKQAIEAYGLANGDLGDVLDAVTKTAQDTGQSVDDLFDKATKGAPQIKALGLNFADGTALIGGFEKAGVNSGAALSSLSKAQVIFAKDGKTLEEGLNGTVDSILNAKTETEALTIASEVFGTKGGPRMVDAIQRGTFNLEDFAGAGEKAAGAVKNTFNETVDPIDQVAIAMNNSKLAMAEVGEVLQVAALPFLQKATEVMGALADKFRAMSPTAKQTALVVAAIGAAIGPVIFAVGSMISMFGGVMTALAPLALKIAQAGGMLKYLRGIMVALTGPVGLTVAAVALLGVAFVAAYKNSETFRNGVSKVVNFIKGIGMTIKETISGIKGLMKDDGQSGRDILTSLGFSPAIVMAMDGVAANIGEFRHKVGGVIDGIKGLFKDDGQVGRDFLSSIGLSDSMVAKIDAIAANISAFRGNIGKTINGIKGLFKDDGSGGRDILSALGFTDGFVKKADDVVLKVIAVRDFLGNALAKVKDSIVKSGSDILAKIQEVFILVWPGVKAAFAGIVSFIGEYIAKIVQFWDENGAVIMKALTNIAKFIGNVIAGIVLVWSTTIPVLLTVLSKVFSGVLSVVKFIMPAVLALIRAVWGNIKGVITGALDVIMGAVKVFAGLFSGDFGKMWEGLKQMFSGAVTFLWNFISLTFFGKMLGGLKLFVGGFKLFFSGMWTSLKTMFAGSVGTLKTTISGAWTSIATTTSRIFGNIWTFIKGLFVKIRDSIAGSVSSIFTKIVTGWTNIFNRTSSIFGIIRDTVVRIFGSVRDTLSRIVGTIFTKISGTWTNLKSSTSRIFGDIFNAVKGKFDDIVSAAKNLPKRIGDGIGSMASKVKEGVNRVVNNLASTLGKGINGVIGGINWVLGKIGVEKDIPKWDIPQYAQGTKGHHPGGPMIVGDGKGSNAGPELIETPDGKQALSPGKPTLTAAPKGTKVWSATATRDILDMIPHYAFGDKLRSAGEWVSDKYNSGKKAVKNIGSKIKDVAVDAFDYIKSPGKFLDLALKTLGIDKPKGGSFIGNMVLGGWNKAKSAAINFVKEKLSTFGASQSGISLTGGNGGGFGSPFRFTSGPGPRNTGIPGASTFHKGWDWAAPIGTKIPSVTDGLGYRTGFHKLSGNFVEVKSGNKVHRYQHNSKNIMRVGQKVKKGQTLGLVGNTGVGSGAHLHYEVKGLETGGIINSEQFIRAGEKNREEIMIPMHPSRRTDAMKLLALAGRKLMPGGDKGITRPNQLPNVAGGSDDGGVLKALLAATMKQNEILMQLLNKEANVYMDSAALVGTIGEPMNENLGNSSKRNAYLSGVR